LELWKWTFLFDNSEGAVEVEEFASRYISELASKLTSPNTPNVTTEIESTESPALAQTVLFSYKDLLDAIGK